MANRKAPQSLTETPAPGSEAWNKLPWRKFEQHVYRIQKRIYRASKRGNVRAVQKLQKLLMKSEAARLLAVRRVTQDNQGKKTAGVDGVKNVVPARRFDLAKQLHPKHWKTHTPKPVRRVWIPKPGKAEKRPLGIPTMLERAKQALVKAGLEPEWEAKFHANSYGFRPGRSCHDAIMAIFNYIRYKPKFVLDADIKGCFDNIDQDMLLKKLNTYPALKHVIQAWLKAGVLEGNVFTPTEAGTPQGGVISPLLANIALHGIEDTVSKVQRKGKITPILIRYADDFVILHPDKDVLDKATEAVTEWLGHIGLHLSPKKTRVTHTLTPFEGNVGFDFLGFTVRQFPVGKTHTGKDTVKRPLGFKTIIKPSKTAIKHHLTETRKVIQRMRHTSQEALIHELNPIIRGWSNYYSKVVSKLTYRKCDHLLFQQLVQWVNWRHPEKNAGWKRKKYWHTRGSRNWVFASGKMTLRLHADTPTSEHIKVRGNASPYDGALQYWSQRLKDHPTTRGTLARLLQRQQGKCKWCELLFRDDDVIEVDHMDNNHANNQFANLAALHRHCHDERHAALPKGWNT